MSQYPSLYSPAHSESGKWDALVKASESLLKEKELIIDRQVFFKNNFSACVGVIIVIALFDSSESYLIFFLQCCSLYWLSCVIDDGWTLCRYRQKQHMAQLEQRLRESELQVHGALLGRGASYSDMCMLRLQVGKIWKIKNLCVEQLSFSSRILH